MSAADESSRSSTATSNEASPDGGVANADFTHNHLNHRSFDMAKLSPGMKMSLTILANVNSPIFEPPHYPHLSTVLTGLSRIIYDDLDAHAKSLVHIRFQVPTEGSATAYLEFIDSHDKSHGNRPDLIGVPNVDRFRKRDGSGYKRVPHHFIETLAVVKAHKKYDLAQAAHSAYRHQQARPDHPAFLCLTVKPQYYQIMLSEPGGVVASAHFPWTDLQPLAIFFHTLYVPRTKHILHDSTVLWKCVPGNPSRNLTSVKITWSITCGEEMYTEGNLIALGDAWGQRTTVFRIKDPSGHRVVIKEAYCTRQQSEESTFLASIHADGDVPGVVRMSCCEDVMVDGQRIECSIGENGTLCTKKRLVLLDYGSHLFTSRSVNDLLRAFYDVLEVHRTLIKKGILHRDMSIYNILIYPRWRKLPGRRMMKDPPPLIQDVLSGILRDEQSRTADCLLIDYDHAAKLAGQGEAPVNNNVLARRTGTPKYIARSDLYIKAYGVDRYNAYVDEVQHITPEIIDFAEKFPHLVNADFSVTPTPKTIHGGRPPKNCNAADSANTSFNHRPEHDVESVCWTMISVLVRIQPAKRPQEVHVPSSLSTLWGHFNSHAIYANPSPLNDERGTILNLDLKHWRSIFEPFPELHDLAGLLHDIACQVRPEYALWDPAAPHPDHLHEAVQRLILQYLVDHKDKDVKLTGDPRKLRPVEPNAKSDLNSEPQAGDIASSVSTELASTMEVLPDIGNAHQLTKRKSFSHRSGTSDAPKTKRMKGDDNDD
ncbi:hypothetical protein L227DRAFT_610175 [Lentinus tigrinus ALCF2SS1-6]|uniref:Fungal-type protein kinase domain-containing protein n=1 Tax=Lentinus tigrinus ALCF2SS1-6 TaxID=1328759 RepID=A0A5C2SEL6_9APHY|nr:hypothetical protein L227DRAFT_610175 [Lentinus tigrinus ALCF2SS1-6]